ncbi:SMI1/KNR4 family protein [Phenylobacterium sp.]|uniref:SMI1/KNR4 family protein n=1 Tax=Phenylobacterium sp. TaxID=1871053 RepID=UPI0025FB5D66|nr:SMI1/KNR4 family protein [Phenylobacterium sp.]MBX3481976.1 SMI1/KNR4 family protein [Phenylobacterium sp.]MCW5758346.1 SMI1/KNR4 family protein [Phenylobacterium sp.]
MSIGNLLRVVPPPERPGDPFPGPWRDIEAKLGTALPSDYKAFVRAYGRGKFMGHIWIWTPRAWDPYDRLESMAPTVLKLFREDEDFTFPLWPEPGGLLPFGSTLDGDYLAWTTYGSPDDWTVTVLDRGMGYQEAHTYGCGMTDFLAGVATGEIGAPAFHPGILECEHLFIPNPRGPDPVVEIGWRLGPFGGSGTSTSRLGRSQSGS